VAIATIAQDFIGNRPIDPSVTSRDPPMQELNLGFYPKVRFATALKEGGFGPSVAREFARQGRAGGSVSLPAALPPVMPGLLKMAERTIRD